MITNVLEYSFILRGLEAGVVIAMIAPLIGIFLVLRRYSLLADTLSHVSLAGVAIGLLLGVNPLLTALAASGVSAIAIERLRATRRIYGETALSLFLSGSLAIALVLLSAARGFNANIFAYLFGSIVTVTAEDVVIIAGLGLAVIGLVLFLYKELVSLSFDEEAAAVSGIPVARMNMVFITLAAVAVAIAIPVVGILLVSALMVIPVAAALQLRTSFRRTLIAAEAISLVSTISGMIASFYLDVSPGGTIVLIMLAVFAGIFVVERRHPRA